MSPIPHGPVADNSTDAIRARIARGFGMLQMVHDSSRNTIIGQFPLTEESNKASKDATKSTAPYNNTPAFNKKRRASALEGAAINKPQHSKRNLNSIPDVWKDPNDYDEDERNGSIVNGPTTTANELKDWQEEPLAATSNVSPLPSPKKLCTGLHDKVLAVDDEAFLLPEGRGDVVTLEADNSRSGRLSHMVNPKVIVIDGERFFLPRGRAEIVALGQEKHDHVDNTERLENDYIGFEEENRKEQKEFDSDLESWIDNYYCYLESRNEESSEHKCSEEREAKGQGTEDQDSNHEELGNNYSAESEEGKQSTQSNTTESSLEQAVCMHGGESHSVVDEEDSTEQRNDEDSESDHSSDWLDDFAGNAHVNAEITLNPGSGDEPPSDSGYDSEIEESDDSDGSDGSSDSSNSDSSFDDLGHNDDNNDGDTTTATTTQAPAVIVYNTICYGPTALPEGQVRGDLMFVLNGELWGINFAN